MSTISKLYPSLWFTTTFSQCITRNNNHLLGIVSFTVIAAAATANLIYKLVAANKRHRPTRKQIIFITGCDTGLGFSLAEYIAGLGFTVIATVLNIESLGAKQLEHQNGIELYELDVTRSADTFKAAAFVSEYIETHHDHELYAVVNNAGVMVFGEFEWLTENLIRHQINVNLIGTFLVTRAFCPLLRQHHNTRLITITSHCAQVSLPGLAVYGATKHGLRGWNDSIRIELAKYGVQTITFQPGSFVQQSSIMARQAVHFSEMRRGFTEEQDSFYGDYFATYRAYLGDVGSPKHSPTNNDSKMIMAIQDDEVYRQFGNALLDKWPRTCYKVDPYSYWIYHMLFRWSPIWLRDYFVVRFVSLPKFTPNN